MSRVLRIGHYSAFLAVGYGLSSMEETDLRKAAPMHDVGNIGIPDHILQKSARLTQQEFEVIKTHTTIGANLMQGSASDVLEAARFVAFFHHEKYDGSGYPRGLEGEAIPVYGRIVSLCDVWAALISERHYKPAYDLDTSRGIIRSERGRHFDPDLVDIFLANLDNLLQMRGEVNSRGTDFSELLTSRQAFPAR